MNTGIILRRDLIHPPTITQMEVKDCLTMHQPVFLKYYFGTLLNAGLETWTPTPNETAGPSRTRRNKRKPISSTTVTSPTIRGTPSGFLIAFFFR